MLCSLQSPGRHNETPRFVFQNNSLIRLEQNSFLASYRRQKEASPGGATYLKGQVSSRSGSWTSPSVLRSPDAPRHLRPRALGWDNPHPSQSHVVKCRFTKSFRDSCCKSDMVTFYAPRLGVGVGDGVGYLTGNVLAIHDATQREARVDLEVTSSSGPKSAGRINHGLCSRISQGTGQQTRGHGQALGRQGRPAAGGSRGTWSATGSDEKCFFFFPTRGQTLGTN